MIESVLFSIRQVKETLGFKERKVFQEKTIIFLIIGYFRMSRPFDSALNRLLESVHCDESMKVTVRLDLNAMSLRLQHFHYARASVDLTSFKIIKKSEIS